MANKTQSRKNIIVACAVTAGQELIRTCLDSLHPENSDDEADDMIEKMNFIEAWIRLGNRGCYKVREQLYVNEIIPRFSGEVFRQHFRMTKTIYENLERQLTPMLSRVGRKGRPMIPVRNQLLSVIWLLATPDSFRVVNALNDIADSVIVWPKGDKLTAVKNRFNKIGVLPDVIGAIDGSHVPILAPHLHSESYRTRKCEYALTLQAVCNAELVFTDCFVRFADSVNDSRIFRNSDLWMSVQENRAEFFPGNEYIGDKAYPVLSWCIPPYINRGNLSEVQIKFNKELSRMRQVVERAFALLKGRFQRLKYLHMSVADLIPYVILACCVLHNLCLEGCNDTVDDFIEEGRQHDEINIAEQNQNRRPVHEFRE